MPLIVASTTDCARAHRRGCREVRRFDVRAWAFAALHESLGLGSVRCCG